MRLWAIKTIKTPLYLWGQWSGAGTGAVGAASPADVCCVLGAQQLIQEASPDLDN